jgi:hypothetical protein
LFFILCSSFQRLRAPERARAAKLARRASARMARVKLESSFFFSSEVQSFRSPEGERVTSLCLAKEK